MEVFGELGTIARGWVSGHLTAIATAFTTALLVIYGDNINRAVKNRVRNRHFLVRAAVFMVLCSFGYGILALMITPALADLLRAAGDRYLLPVVVGTFVCIGVLADRKRYM